MRFINKLCLCSLVLVASPLLRAESLSLDGFLDQVKKQNGKVQGSLAARQAARDRSDEASLIYWPKLSAGVETRRDQRESSSSRLYGDDTTVNAWNLGLEQQTSFGLLGKLNYMSSTTKFKGANPLFISEPEATTGGLSLELTQSLWKNGFGRETRALNRVTQLESESAYNEETFQAKQLLSEAEITYVRLAIARDIVNYQRQILVRSKSIRSWSSQRTNLKLADSSDLFQAQAAVAARELELRVAEDEELAARRAFNLMRGVSGSEVVESLDVSGRNYLDAETKVSSESREDLKVLEAQNKLSRARAQLSEEKNKPQLDIYATYGTSGYDTSASEATSESLTTEHPYQIVGLRFSAPLAFGKSDSVASAYRAQQTSLEAKIKQIENEQAKTKTEMTEKLELARSRLRLVENLESAQKKKLDHERSRLNKGRSTTYQVLLFEQDYLNSQLSLARTKQEIFNLISQLKTYGDLQ